MKQQRMLFPDLLRTVASLLVVAIHVTSIGIHDYSTDTVVWAVSTGLNALIRWSVPVFFMISGMFFLNPEKELSVKTLFRKNILRIAVCIIVWGFFYSLLDQYLYSAISAKSVVLAIYGILTGNTGYHLWFLYDLVMLYAGVPVFRIITKNATRKQLEYILLLWFAVFIVLGNVSELANGLFGFENSICLTAYPITGYAGYFMLGDYLNRYPLRDKVKRWVYVCGVIGLAVNAVMAVVIPKMFGIDISAAVSSNNTAACALTAVTVFCMASGLNEETVKPRMKCVLRFIGKYSFGIYLTHVLWITLIFRIFKCDLTLFGPIVSVPVFVLVIYMLSILTSYLLSKIPCVRRIV